MTNKRKRSKQTPRAPAKRRATPLPPDAIRDAVADRMAQLNMTRYAVAKASGVPYSTLSDWLAGRRSIGSGALQHVLRVLRFSITFYH